MVVLVVKLAFSIITVQQVKTKEKNTMRQQHSLGKQFELNFIYFFLFYPTFVNCHTLEFSYVVIDL